MTPTEAAEFLARPRRSRNVRLATVVYAVFIDLAVVGLLSNALSDRATGGWIIALVAMFSAIVIALSIRLTMISVTLVDGVLRIRNPLKTMHVPVEEASHAEFGFSAARSASGKRSGSLVLRDGGILRVWAISDGSLAADGRDSKTLRIVDAINVLASGK